MAELGKMINDLIAEFSWQGVMDIVTFIVEKVLGFVAKEEGIVTE